MVLEIFTDLGVCGSVLPERERGGGETDTVTERQREKEVGREQHNDRVSKHEFTASNLVVFRGYF